ncbi:major facilitator superfamily domain-containing protein 9 [Athalia rosae]|uniref:major facilitator superfamily domain-containing protein 9 n=1 Tax=Athalia rosae TaxID=37344 RepID=UPI00203477A1|nr:major facilitator superfamily domain-containing protein 9 [Athalia rosae]
MAFDPTWVYAISFMDLFAVSLSIPLLSTHLRSLGASHMLIGFSSSLYAGAQLISGPIIGSWSDRKGRQMVLLTSLIICVISYVFLGMLKSLVVVLVIRLILGIFKHIQVLTRTIVADQIPSEEQSRVSGRLTALSSAGFIIGPVIGGHLAELENGFTYLCYLTALLFALNIAMTYLFLPDCPKAQLPDETETIREKKKCASFKEEMICAVRDLADIDWAMYWDIFALKFLMGISQAIFFSNYFLNVQETYNVSPKWTGYTISFQGIVGASAGLLAGWVDQKLYKNDLSFRQRNLHGFIIMAVAYTGLLFSPTLFLFMLWTIPLRASCAILRIVGTDMILKRGSATQRGSLVGTGNSISNIARLVAPLLAGFMGDLYGTNTSALLSTIISVLGIILLLTTKQHTPPVRTKAH